MASGLNRQLKQIKTIDLRYPNGLAVAWKEGALAEAWQGTREENRQERAAAIEA